MILLPASGGRSLGKTYFCGCCAFFLNFIILFFISLYLNFAWQEREEDLYLQEHLQNTAIWFGATARLQHLVKEVLFRLVGQAHQQHQQQEDSMRRRGELAGRVAGIAW
jgi:hypothetical protein